MHILPFEEENYVAPLMKERDLSALNARLTAFWAMCEIGVGAALHFFVAPLAPLITGFFGVLTVALLCWYNDNRPEPLIRAWLVIFLVKFAMNPLGLPTSYLGFTFQAFWGLFCYRNIRNFQVAALTHGFFSLFELSFLRVLFAGVNSKIDWWRGKAAFTANAFSDRFVAKWIEGSTNMAAFYVAMMVFAGLVAGWIVLFLVQHIEEEKTRIDEMGSSFNLRDYESAKRIKKEKKAQEKAEKRAAKRKAKGKPEKKKTENYAFPLMIVGLGLGLWILGKPIGLKMMQAGLFWLVVFTDFVRLYMIDWVQRTVDFIGHFFGYPERPDLRQTASQLPNFRLSLRAAWQIAGQRTQNIVQRIEVFAPLVFAIALREPVQVPSQAMTNLEIAREEE